MPWCWASGFQECRCGSGLWLLERTAHQPERAWSSEGWDQKTSEVCNNSVKPGFTVKKQEPAQIRAKPCCCLLELRQLVVSCLHTLLLLEFSLPIISSPVHYSEPLGHGRDMQVGWWNHWTLCIAYDAHWDTGSERRSRGWAQHLGSRAYLSSQLWAWNCIPSLGFQLI